MPLSLPAAVRRRQTTRQWTYASTQRGLSLVELMVGITVGLIVVAAASVMVSSQLADNRRLVAEAQVQQDLRASVDIITRELRRAGGSSSPADFVWDPSAAGEPVRNTLADSLTPTSGSSSEVTFAYQAAAGATSKGFRHNSANGSIESLQGGSWQELTDRNTIEVTEFVVTRLPDATAMVHCAQACSGSGGTDCWPRVAARALALTVAVRSRALPEVTRRHEAVIRLRNDHLPSYTGGTNLCPA